MRSTARCCWVRRCRRHRSKCGGLFSRSQSENRDLVRAFASEMRTLVAISFDGGVTPMAQQRDLTKPEQFVFEDDGIFPNSRLPLLLYRRALRADGKDSASIFEER